MIPFEAVASRRTRFALFAAFIVGLALYYTGRPPSGSAPLFDVNPSGLYHELTEAFLAGQTSLLAAPAPELVRLADPYDPTLNAPWRRDNVSYFRGAYFLYHSSIPVIVLFAPLRLIIGSHLAEDTAVAVFSFAGAMAMLACVIRLRRSYFPNSPSTLLVLCFAAVSLGSAQFAVLRNATANHAAIACAACFLSLGFYFALRALGAASGQIILLAATGLCQGLAVASRPNYIFSSLALGAVLCSLSLRRTNRASVFTRKLIVQAVALGTPLACVVACVAAYNFARYGNPIEFGARTMLGGWNQTSLPASDLGPMLQNAWHYFVAIGEYRRYFPFVLAPTWLAVGVLPNLPFVFGALLLFVVKLRPPVTAFASLVGGVFVTNTLTLLALPSGNNTAILASANQRYLVDFVPSLVLLACIGILAAGEAWQGRPTARRYLVTATSIITLWSIFSSISLDCQRLPAESYRWFARVVNLPVAAVEFVLGTKHGAVVLDLTFPTDRVGRTEPLLQTGSTERGDLVWVRYETGGYLRFGHSNLAVGGPTGALVKVDLSRPHQVEISLGSLTPPNGHPVTTFLSEPALAFLQRRVRITLDGTVVLDAASRSQAATPDQIVVGANQLGPGLTDSRFTGHILHTTRAALVAPEPRLLPNGGYGALQLRVRLPEHPTGRREPLVTSGVPQAGDIIFINYEDSHHIRIGFDHWGRGGPSSEPIKVDYSAPLDVEISLGSLYPPPAHAWWGKREASELRSLKGIVQVKINGQTALSAALGTFESSPYDVTIGQNLIGASSCALEFSGEILTANRIPAPGAVSAR